LFEGAEQELVGGNLLSIGRLRVQTVLDAALDEHFPDLRSPAQHHENGRPKITLSKIKLRQAAFGHKRIAFSMTIVKRSAEIVSLAI
jgi:hypothetical protein